MDGLVILGAQGRPIVLSRFRNRNQVYPLLHVDSLNSMLRRSGENEKKSERDLPPVLVIPVAEDVLQEAASDDDARSESSSSRNSGPSSNVWKAGEQGAEGAAAHPVEGGAVLCHLSVGELRFLCPVSREIDPLIPISFLRKVVEVLQVYLAGSDDPALMTEDLICEHFDIVYQLLEEMLDGDGNVLLTEVNTLKDIVLPPSWLDRLVSTVGLGSKYTKNEIYLDCIETLEGIVDAHGRPVALELLGRIEGTAWLSGTPSLNVPLTHPALVRDAAWHACVRHAKWKSSQVLNFLPPDGPFTLGHYRLATPLANGTLGNRAVAGSDSTLPLFMEVQLDEWDAAQGSHAFTITLTSKLASPRTLTDVVVEWQLGDRAQGLDAAVHSHGSATSTSSASHASGGGAGVAHTALPTSSAIFDRKRHLLRWTLPKLAAGGTCSLRGTILAHDVPSRPLYALQVHFVVQGHSLSGVRAKEIQVDQVSYVATKGVRNALHGHLEWRR